MHAEDGLAEALAGDQLAFGQLVERYRRELRVHCYRMLGSFEDSEDLVQETFLRAWRRRDGFAGRGTFRAWLYKIATNACLDFLDRHPRRPLRYAAATGVTHGAEAQAPPRVPWLQPFPDRLLELRAPSEDEPHAIVVTRETVELAFMVAIQHLAPRQRAVLILCDIVGWPAAETAALLGASVVSVRSALQRARATLKERLPRRREDWAPSSDPTEQEHALLRRYIAAHERADVDGLAELLADDVRVTMPPHPECFVGREAVLALTATVFDPESSWYHGQWRSVPTRANRQPAVAQYVQRPSAEATRELPGEFRGQVLDVLRIEGGLVTQITSFEPHLFPAFGLPLTL